LDLSDWLVIVGLAMLGGGLGAYDWRLALVVCGAVVLVSGLWLVSRAARSADG
jgi:hypothetical protein